MTQNPHEHDDCHCAHDTCHCAHDDCHCAHDDCHCAHDTCHRAHDESKPCAQAQPGFQSQDPNKGVSLGPDVEGEIAEIMAKRYARFLTQDEKFAIKTEVCHHFGLVSSTLSNPSRTTWVCVETSVECEDNHIENPIEAYQKALDVLDLVWLDYFDSDRISHYLPIWQSYEIDDLHVNVRLEHYNPALDDQASEFLLAHGYNASGLSESDYDED